MSTLFELLVGALFAHVRCVRREAPDAIEPAVVLAAVKDAARR
jgi:hypothetical protein